MGRRLPLAEQLRLLEIGRRQVRALRERGGSPSRVEALANDLAGARFSVSAALLASGIGQAEREDLERREREARELLGEVRALGSAGRSARIAPGPSGYPG